VASRKRDRYRHGWRDAGRDPAAPWPWRHRVLVAAPSVANRARFVPPRGNVLYGSAASWLSCLARPSTWWAMRAAVLFMLLVPIGGCSDQSDQVQPMDGSVRDGSSRDGAVSDASARDGSSRDGAVSDESADGLDGSAAVDVLPDLTCREWSGGDSATACDECVASETCVQFFDGLGGYWKIRCCRYEQGRCSPDQCTGECDDLLCAPVWEFCICNECPGLDPDPRAYPCCCP